MKFLQVENSSGLSCLGSDICRGIHNSSHAEVLMFRPLNKERSSDAQDCSQMMHKEVPETNILLLQGEYLWQSSDENQSMICWTYSRSSYLNPPDHRCNFTLVYRYTCHLTHQISCIWSGTPLEIKTKQKRAEGKTDLFCPDMQWTSTWALSLLVCSGEQAHFLGREIPLQNIPG